jgi:tetratricopeptide (TPR) repeat protein
MDKERYPEAEALFPEIELLQPENTAVSEWRKKIVIQNEKAEQEAERKRQISRLHQLAWTEYRKGLDLVREKNYWDALDIFDELLTRPIQDKKLIQAIQVEIKKSEAVIAAERDPLIAEGKQFEQEGKFSEAYRSYQKAVAVDPTDTQAPEGMKRIRGNLNGRAKSIYAEGVFAESYGDIETAEKQYRQVLEVVPSDDDYYSKAQLRLKKLSVFRRPASGETAQ